MEEGQGLKNTQNLAAKTVTGYLHAAVTWIQVELDITVHIYHPTKPNGLHLALSELLCQRKSWYKPQPKKEPFTHEMLTYLHDTCHQKDLVNTKHQLEQTTAIFDWACLGTFTGSHLSKYGQSKCKGGEAYATVPINEIT